MLAHSARRALSRAAGLTRRQAPCAFFSDSVAKKDEGEVAEVITAEDMLKKQNQISAWRPSPSAWTAGPALAFAPPPLPDPPERAHAVRTRRARAWARSLGRAARASSAPRPGLRACVVSSSGGATGGKS